MRNTGHCFSSDPVQVRKDWATDSKPSVSINTCCPKCLLKAQPGPHKSSSQTTLKLWTMNGEGLTQASFAEEGIKTAHIPSSNIWVLGPCGSENLREFLGPVNSTCAHTDALKSTPGGEALCRLLLCVHRLSYFCLKGTVLCFFVPVVFSSDPPWTQAVQASSGDLINSAPDEDRPVGQGNSWKTNGLGLPCNSISWTSLICKYNKYCSHSVKARLPSACTNTRACYTTDLPSQDSSWSFQRDLPGITS